MDEPIHYVGHAFDRVVEIAVEALALSGGREQPEGPWDENGIPSVDDDENHSSVPTSREQPAGLRETLIVAHEALVQVCPPYTNRMQRIVDEAKAAVLEVLASPDQESERAPCGRLLVGRGDDTYDPECGLPRGHSGPCEPEVSRPLPAAGLSEEAIEAAERATATAEKLIDAITEISGHLNDDRLADKAKIFKVRLVIVRLDQGGQDDRDT